MESPSRPRVLLLAEQCNPEWPSLPIVAYKVATNLASRCDVTVVTQTRNETAIRKLHPSDSDELRFVFIDTEYVAGPLHKLARKIRGNSELNWSTELAMMYLPYLEFERRAWRRFKTDLSRGVFDVVHRLTPMSPALPSFAAGRGPQPFVIGPLNGALPWPKEFASEQKRERESLRTVREAYKMLPYARRTWRRADLILAAFQHTIDDLPAAVRKKVRSFPEVGYDESIFFPPADLSIDVGGVTFLFAGRLVPYKLAEVAIRAFAGSADLTSRHKLRIVGDGPERPRLEALVRELDCDRIFFEGRADQPAVARAMRESQVFVFPSIRELGAGVVVEAMACGMYPIVVDYGGPADLVDATRGTKVALEPFDKLVLSVRSAMEWTARSENARAVQDARQQAVAYAGAHFPWALKAAQLEAVYRDVMRS